MTARQLAAKLLEQTESADSYSNLLLDHALETAALEQRDKRLCAALYYGVLERQITLDYVIGTYSKKPPQKLDSIVRQILRLGLYQLLYMEQIPDNAAVSESVSLTKKFRKASASGFVNAVLRGFLRDGKQIRQPKTETECRAVQYSVPEWLLHRLTAAYGAAQTDRFLENALLPPPVTIRINPLRATEQQLLEACAACGIQKHPQIPGCYLLSQGNVRKNRAFSDGWFHVQDAASQLCALALDAKPGMTVLDVCAAPGGKSFTVAEQMEGRGTLYAFDLQPHRAELIRSGAKRLGLDGIVQAAAGDATVWNPELPQADRVLCDVPCSGIGVIRRKPEIRYKDEASLASLPAVQAAILETAAKYVKPGGTLLYSTCTILPEENEQVVAQFLAQHPEFTPQPLFAEDPEPLLPGTMATLFPEQYGSDGFFLAKLRRSAEA